MLWDGATLVAEYDNANALQRRYVFGSSRSYINVDSEIEPADDIELKPAYFEGRLVLYWRETFQNRIYRQGLFNIAGHTVVSRCAGRGGRQVER